MYVQSERHSVSITSNRRPFTGGLRVNLRHPGRYTRISNVALCVCRSGMGRRAELNVSLFADFFSHMIIALVPAAMAGRDNMNHEPVKSRLPISAQYHHVIFQ